MERKEKDGMRNKRNKDNKRGVEKGTWKGRKGNFLKNELL